jgi:protocatechuate 3,4-dioxygenase, alpha subunit
MSTTPGQTVGPFFGYALPFPGGDRLVAPDSPGAIVLHGTVRDGAGEPIPDALLEIWQADEHGVIPTATGSFARDGVFTGFGRAETDAFGHYELVTVAPGPTSPGAAPFFALALFARGLLDRVFTRAYLPGAALATDPLLTAVAPERRDTLVVVPDDVGLRFDIRLQAGADGAAETVFLSFGGVG